MPFGCDSILDDGLFCFWGNSDSEGDDFGIGKFSIFDIPWGSVSNVGVDDVDCDLISLFDFLSNWLQLFENRFLNSAVAELQN